MGYIADRVNEAEAGTTFYVQGVNEAGADALDLSATGDTTLADIAAGNRTHGPTAVGVTIEAVSSNLNVDPADLSGTYDDPNNANGDTKANVYLSDVGATATGEAREIVGIDYKPHAVAQDGADDDLTHEAVYTFQVQG